MLPDPNPKPPRIRIAKNACRRLVAQLLEAGGFLNCWADVRLRRRISVLMYHRVLDERQMKQNFSQESIVIDRRTFADQMGHLKRRFNLISLSTFKRMLYGEIPPQKKCCLVTFDDGWKDTWQNAYPVLTELQIPAVVFLPADYIGSAKRFWQERLTHGLMRLRAAADRSAEVRRKALEAMADEEITPILNSSQGTLRGKITDYVLGVKRAKSQRVEQLLVKLEKTLKTVGGRPGAGEDFMSWDEVKRMAQDGIEFGSHGISHRRLPLIGKDALHEIAGSREFLENKLGRAVISFSYPNGDYTSEIVRWVAERGYKLAFGTVRGLVAYNDSPYTLKRININKDVTQTLPLFTGRLLNLW